MNRRTIRESIRTFSSCDLLRRRGWSVGPPTPMLVACYVANYLLLRHLLQSRPNVAPELFQESPDQLKPSTRNSLNGGI